MHRSAKGIITLAAHQHVNTTHFPENMAHEEGRKASSIMPAAACKNASHLKVSQRPSRQLSRGMGGPGGCSPCGPAAEMGCEGAALGSPLTGLRASGTNHVKAKMVVPLRPQLPCKVSCTGTEGP